jgi:hypothetical protein
MTATDLVATLDDVRSRGSGKWSARCPAHADKSPSLSITDGDRAILLKCWAGCSLQEITDNLGIKIKDLFFDGGLPTTAENRQDMEKRAQERAAHRAIYEARGRHMDALRQAEHLVRSAKEISIDQWLDVELGAALDRLGVAYALLESEGCDE